MRSRGTVPASFLLPGWMHTPWLSVGVAKEAREILPFALVALLTSLTWLTDFPGVDPSGGWVLYLAGEVAVVAMGAAAFGHEFSHRTLPLALSQPMARRDLWLRKMQVLGAAMTVLFLVRMAGPVLRGNGHVVVSFAGLMSVASLGFGLLVAPVMALWSRSTLAGTVFTVALPIVLWQGAALVACVPYGLENRESSVVQDAAIAWFVAAVLVTWLFGPLFSYGAFRRLEAGEARGVAVSLPRVLGSLAGRRPVDLDAAPGRTSAVAGRGRVGVVWARSRPRNIVALIGKEVRLLGPAFVVAGIYLLIAGFDLALRRLGGSGVAGTGTSELLAIATVIYGLLVSLLIGSLACAEERHAGTLSWQLVQPVAAWKQWAVKSGTSLAVAVALAIGLPLLVVQLGRALLAFGSHDPVVPIGTGMAALQVVALCTLALYVSTLTATALRAMLWAAPIWIVLQVPVWGILDSPATRSGLWNWFVPFETEGRTLFSAAGVGWAVAWGLLLLGFLVVVLGCAFSNYRTLVWQPGRVVRQIMAVLGYGVVAVVGALAFKHVVGLSGATLPMRPETRAEVEARLCEANISAIGDAVSRWAAAHDHQPPANLGLLTAELPSPEVLICPADRERFAAPDWTSWSPEQVTYRYEPLAGPAAPYWSAEIGCPIHGTRTVTGVIRMGGQVEPPAEAGSASNTTVTMPPRLLLRYGLRPASNTTVTVPERVLLRYGLRPAPSPRADTEAAEASDGAAAGTKASASP